MDLQMRVEQLAAAEKRVAEAMNNVQLLRQFLRRPFLGAGGARELAAQTLAEWEDLLRTCIAERQQLRTDAQLEQVPKQNFFGDLPKRLRSV